jgi:hypothetical protein
MYQIQEAPMQLPRMPRQGSRHSLARRSFFSTSKTSPSRHLNQDQPSPMRLCQRVKRVRPNHLHRSQTAAGASGAPEATPEGKAADSEARSSDRPGAPPKREQGLGGGPLAAASGPSSKRGSTRAAFDNTRHPLDRLETAASPEFVPGQARFGRSVR